MSVISLCVLASVAPLPALRRGTLERRHSPFDNLHRFVRATDIERLSRRPRSLLYSTKKALIS